MLLCQAAELEDVIQIDPFSTRKLINSKYSRLLNDLKLDSSCLK